MKSDGQAESAWSGDTKKLGLVGGCSLNACKGQWFKIVVQLCNAFANRMKNTLEMEEPNNSTGKLKVMHKPEQTQKKKKKLLKLCFICKLQNIPQ